MSGLVSGFSGFQVSRAVGRRRRILLAGTALAAGLAAFAVTPQSAFAACVLTSSAGGTDTYVCSGSDVAITQVATNTTTNWIFANQAVTGGAATFTSAAGDNLGFAQVQSIAFIQVPVPTISSTLPNFRALFLSTNGGNIDITTSSFNPTIGLSATNTGQIIASGTGTADGIYAAQTAIGGLGNINITANGYIRATEHGIYANNNGFGTTTIINNGFVGADSLTNTIQPVGGNGIFVDIGANGSNGQVTVTNNGQVYAAGHGIAVSSLDGAPVSVTNNGLIGFSTSPIPGNGIDVVTNDGLSFTGGGTDIVNNNSIYTNGASSRGINAQANGTTGYVNVTNNGFINTPGNLASGIVAAINNGANADAVFVWNQVSGNIQTPNGFDAINASTAGTGAVTVWNDGIVQGWSNGINAQITNAVSAADVTVINGLNNQPASINATVGNGINAQNSGTGNVLVTNYGEIGSAGTPIPGIGINASAITGTVTVNNYNFSITSVGDGVHAVSGGNVFVNNGDPFGINPDGQITSTAGYGIFALSTGGGIVGVTNSGVTSYINAFLDGINAVSQTGAGTVGVLNYGLIDSTTGNGIYARTQFGATGDVNVANMGTIGSTGPVGLDGIYARASRFGGGNVNVGNGWLGPILDPTFALLNTNALINATQNGIHAVIDGNPSAGQINIANYGVSALRCGTNGQPACIGGGIFAGAGFSAIEVDNYSQFSQTNIYNNGTLRGDGTVNGVIFIDNNGVGVDTTPTFIVNDVDGDIRSNTGSPADLAVFTNTTDGQVHIDNFGHIVGTVDLTNGNDSFHNELGADWTSSGDSYIGYNNTAPYSLFNEGTIKTAGVTTFHFELGPATTVASSAIVNNTGAIWVHDIGAVNPWGLAAAPGMVIFQQDTGGLPVGLLTFKNSGVIEMQRDACSLGSTFAACLPSDGTTVNTVLIEGNFIASGFSTLGVDSFLGAPGSKSDRLGIAGTVTGVTAINVHDTNAGPGAYNPTGIAVVGMQTPGSGSLANFFLSPFSSNYDPRFGGVMDKGLFFYFLANDPFGTSAGCGGLPGAHCVSLYSLPDVGAQQLPMAVTGAINIWHETALMVEDRQAELRTKWFNGMAPGAWGGADMPVKARAVAPAAAPATTSVWLKGIGSWTDRKATETETFAGLPFQFDLGYKQNTYGLIGGADFSRSGVLNSNDTVVFGPMGGYVQSTMNFNVAGTSFKYSGGTVGGSLSYLAASGFFADALVKADFLRLQVNTPSLAGFGFAGDTIGATTWGALGDIGYRWNGGTFFVEPTLTAAWATTRIDNLSMPALATTASFGNGESFRGAAGGRIGTSLPNWQMHKVEVSVTGRVWDEFLGNNNTVTLTNVGPTVTLSDNYQKVFGEVKGAIDVMSIGAGWSGFVNGGVKFNNDFTTITAKAGVTKSW